MFQENSYHKRIDKHVHVLIKYRAGESLLPFLKKTEEMIPRSIVD